MTVIWPHELKPSPCALGRTSSWRTSSASPTTSMVRVVRRTSVSPILLSVSRRSCPTIPVVPSRRPTRRSIRICRKLSLFWRSTTSTRTISVASTSPLSLPMPLLRASTSTTTSLTRLRSMRISSSETTLHHSCVTGLVTTRVSTLLMPMLRRWLTIVLPMLRTSWWSRSTATSSSLLPVVRPSRTLAIRTRISVLLMRPSGRISGT